MGNIVLKLLLNETEKMARILLNSRMLNCMIHPLMSRKRIFAFIGDTLSFTLLVFFFFERAVSLSITSRLDLVEFR